MVAFGPLATVLGGVMGSNAVTSGRDAANAAQMQMYQQTRNDLGPYREAGLAPLQAQEDLLGLNGQPAADAAMSNFQSSPGYQFQLEQGLRGVDAGAAAKGLLRSGATLKAEQTFGTGLADQEFGNYYNRLMGLSTLGETAAGQTGTAATATGQGIASTDASAGAALASIYGNVAKGLSSQSNQLMNSAMAFF
jgi:hypothetical protein